MPLTDVQCRNAAKRDKDYKLADEKGLHLFVSATGFKSWRWKFRVGGKEKRLVFGPYPEVSLSKARQKRDEARALLRDGIDPALHQRQRRASQVADAATSFEGVTRRWLESRKAQWSERHADDVTTRMEGDVFPAIGNLPIASVTAPMVRELLEAVEKRGALETAHRLRQRISDIFGFAIANSLATSDPAAALKKALAPIRRGRWPALTTLTDAQDLVRAVDTSTAAPAVKLASRFLALTAVRPGVLRETPWSEFAELDPTDPIWRIPAARMKLGKARKGDQRFDFLVPLSRQAMEVIAVMKRLTGRGPLVWPNNRHAHQPMSDGTLTALYDRLPAFAGRHVAHGWRSTFSTLMNERASELDRPADHAVSDLMLAHLPSGVEGIYNRAAYLPRRRLLAQEWADLVLQDALPPSVFVMVPRL